MKSKIVIALLCGCLGACIDPHAQNSRIVREVEANGSGDLTTYTLPDLKQWFTQRPELAKKIAAECAPISANAQANWLRSAEGTTCSAAMAVNTWIPRDWKADQRKW